MLILYLKNVESMLMFSVEFCSQNNIFVSKLQWILRDTSCVHSIEIILTYML